MTTLAAILCALLTAYLVGLSLFWSNARRQEWQRVTDSWRERN